MNAVEKRERIKIEELQSDRISRSIEEETAKNIDSCKFPCRPMIPGA